MSVLNYIIQVVISIIVITLIHYLYNYFKETYTVKKTKDVYQFHQTKYNEIFETMKQGQEADDFKNELLQFAMEEDSAGQNVSHSVSHGTGQNVSHSVSKEEPMSQNIEYDLTEFTKSL